MTIRAKSRKGHGAISNPEGRFESRRVEAVDDGWPMDSDQEPPPLATTISAELAKSIISRNTSPDIPFEQSINPYRGCGHACVYCLLGDTNILMGNGHTKRLGDLEIGDEIIGTERRGLARRYVNTRVLAHWATHKPAYRMTLLNGTHITASADHRFLSDRGWKFVVGSQDAGKRRAHLAVGDQLLGVGMSTQSLAATPGFSQSYAAVIDKIIEMTAFVSTEGMRGYQGESFDDGAFSNGCAIIAKPEDAMRRWVAANLALHPLSVFGNSLLRCKRLICQRAVEAPAGLGIVAIEPLGKSMPMFDITTGTGDFIADGVVSHNCYARPAHAYVNLSPGLDFETKLFYKENAAELLRKELSQPRYVCKSITLGANTDPYQPIERKLKVTRSILEVLQEFRHPVAIITKGHLVERDIDILAPMARDNLAAVHVSVTTLDSDLKRILEPRAPAAAARLHAIRALHAAGVPVGALVAPVIPAINDHEIEHIVEAVAQAGARSAGYVMLRLPYEVKDLFREWLAEHHPLRAAHVMSLVNDLRGGRDNDPNFGSRMRGTGPFAELVRRRFEVACGRHGLNTVRRVPLDTGLFRSPSAPAAQLDLGF
ncbi:MAG TPA: PA0069 family radical SAM protein [Steroidobacteraceae bacterium]